MRLVYFIQVCSLETEKHLFGATGFVTCHPPTPAAAVCCTVWHLWQVSVAAGLLKTAPVLHTAFLAVSPCAEMARRSLFPKYECSPDSCSWLSWLHAGVVPGLNGSPLQDAEPSSLSSSPSQSTPSHSF